MKIYIYLIWFPTSNKYYIGQTQNLKARMDAHLNSNYLVGRALNKYDDWQISVLHIRKSRNETNLLEIEEIRNYNSVAPNGYNLTRGGDGLFNPSEETKKKMSKANKGRKNPKVSKSLKGNKRAKGSKSISGQKRSEETKAKISKSLSNIKFSESRKVKMRGRKLSKISILKRERTKLKNRIAKLEKEL